MTLDACIAHAIHSNLDILQAVPSVEMLPVEELEPYIESYITDMHNSIYTIVCEHGEKYIRAGDAAGLCATLQHMGIELPSEMLLNMCQTILHLNEMDATFILDTDEGDSLYLVKMNIDVPMTMLTVSC